MKRILSYIFGLGLLFTACNPMNDIYDDLDMISNPFVRSIEIVLADADYEAIGGDPAKYYNFSQYAPVEDYIPDFLAEKYPALGQGSVALVTYNYYRGGLSYLDYLTDSKSYELTTDDYDSMGEESGQPGKYNNFDATIPPDNYLPDFFAAKYPDAESGDIIFVTYKFYSGGVSNLSEYYRFDGSVWAPFEVDLPDGVSVYELSADDYDSMGENSGQPGKYNDFDSSIPPENYLDKFLSINFPYAVEGDKIAVVYNYYSGGIEKRADEYTLTNGVWQPYESVVEKTDQFIHTGVDGWLFDPSVVFKMVSSDYQIIVDDVKSKFGDEYVDSYGTAEFYYGAGSYYSNFDFRDGKWNSSAFATWQDALKEGISESLLPNKFPDAVAQVSGVDVLYKVTFDTYDGGYDQYTYVFQCTKSGPNPEFEFVKEL